MCKKHIRDSQDLIFVSVSQLYLDSTTASPSITEKAGGKWVKAETNKSNGSQDGFQASKRQWKQVKRWSRFREPRNVIFRLHRFHGFFVKKKCAFLAFVKKGTAFQNVSTRWHSYFSRFENTMPSNRPSRMPSETHQAWFNRRFVTALICVASVFALAVCACEIWLSTFF